jgi:uncharacterized phosphosugar-binding protein
MTSKAAEYILAVKSLLEHDAEMQSDNMHRAAEILARTIEQDGIIYTFGTGHSHLVAEEACYRTGSLLPVDAINERSLSGHEKVMQSERMERVEGMAKPILDYYNLTAKDSLVIISNSGRNAAPIEMAMGARQRGVPVIAITSLAHSQGTTSRHSSGKKLYQLADVVLDNGCPLGDCLLHLGGLNQPVGAVSNPSAIFLLTSIIVGATQLLLEHGVEPPVPMSGWLEGSEEFNARMMARYRGRIKTW